MLRSFIFFALILISIPNFSQTIPLINSGEVITTAKVLYDSAKYDEAIKALLKVPERDTNYVYMLTELALTYTANKDYDKALQTCDKILEKPSIYRAAILRTQAIATDKKGDVEKAIALFEKAIKEYPNDYLAIYNLGITYYNSKAYEKAEDCFFKVLSINPFHSGSHFNLGRIAVGQGRKVHGMLSLGMYLSINTKDNVRLILLNNFLDNQITDEATLPTFGINTPDKLDQIIRAKIALDKNFKSTIPISAPVVKQYELLFEQLNTISTTTDDRWLKYYLPLYKSMKESDVVEPFIYHLLSSADNEVAKKWRKKNDKKLESLYVNLNTSLKKIRENILIESFGFDKPVNAWYRSSHELEALGAFANDKKIGHWVYFYPDNNQKESEGEYNDQGKKKGIWKFYGEDGSVKSIENIDTGEVTGYSSTGSILDRFFLKEDKTDGDVFLYYKCGALKEKPKYDGGKRNGPGEVYFASGKINMTFQYKDNKAYGEFVSYFENGQVKNRINYKDDLNHGKYTVYYINGKLRTDGEYLNGIAKGTWKYYHNNGKLKQTGSYNAKGLATGEWLYYDAQGSLAEKKNIDIDGKLQGDNSNYRNGKLHYIDTYKKDLLVKSTFYNQEGIDIIKNGASDGTFPVKNYYITGQLMSEGAYKKGKATGLWKYYNRFGKLTSEHNYVEGMLQGMGKQFYPSGEKKIEQEYKDDEAHGYYKEYHRNGKVKEEGWFQNGNRQQQWLCYNSDGSLESDYYYLNNEFTSANHDYTPDGKIFSTSIYDDEGVTDLKHFTSKGISNTEKKQDNFITSFEDRYDNKKLKIKYDVLCGDYVNAFLKWYPDGTTLLKYDLLGGSKHGLYEYYDFEGNLETIGEYTGGDRSGTWKSFHDNGNLFYEGKYVNNNRDSIWTYYLPTGKINSRVSYQNNERQGIGRYYSPDGLLILEKLFEEDNFISYRPVDAHGETGAWIPFSGTGKIEIKYPNGNKAIEEDYKDGVRHGYKRLYYADGTICEDYTLNMGDFEGEYKEYHANGKLAEQGTYKDDELQGKLAYFNEDGSLRKVKTYIDGTLHGKSTSYNKGVKTKEVTFWGGVTEE